MAVLRVRKPDGSIVDIPAIGNGGGLNIAGAEIGQVPQIYEVDENGVPTAWAAVTALTRMELIHSGAAEKTASYLINADMDGNPFSLSEFELEYTFNNPAGKSHLNAPYPAFNGLKKPSFSTNGNNARLDSYLCAFGDDSTIDESKGVYYLHKYVGKIVDGVLIMRAFTTGYGYDADGNAVNLSGASGGFVVGEWNDIVSKGPLFPDGLSSIEINVNYSGFINAKVTLRGVRNV